MAEEDKKFEVRDKRVFNQEGEQVREAPREERRDEPISEGHEGKHIHPGAADELPPVDFISFVGSLGASALMYLGEKIAPDQPDGIQDLPAAKQMIDLIALLEEKTGGNLSEEESHMMQSLLYNLRIRYVRETEKK